MLRGDGKSHGRDPMRSQHMELFTLRGNCQLGPVFSPLISTSDREIIPSSDEKSDPSYIGLEMSMLVSC